MKNFQPQRTASRIFSRSLSTISLSIIGLLGILCLSLGINQNALALTIPNHLEVADASSVWDKKPDSNQSNLEMTVYRSPSCGCCGSWIEQMQQHGFKINEIKTNDMDALKEQYNLPTELASCHTAMIDGYLMEGHIPADDIKRFLSQKPRLAGLTVPGMTIGTPGMEQGNKKQPFQVLAFDNQGKVAVFQDYQSY